MYLSPAKAGMVEHAYCGETYYFDTEKLDAFIEIMKPLGIIEMCRTGIVALERGEGSIFSVCI